MTEIPEPKRDRMPEPDLAIRGLPIKKAGALDPDQPAFPAGLELLASMLEETPMIKDILAHIPTERPERPLVDASVSLASTFAAHLDAIALGYIATSAALAADGGDAAAVAALFEAEQREAAKRTAAALVSFQAKARNAKIAYETKSIEDIPAVAAKAIGYAARLYDLSVVLQPGTEGDTFDNKIPTEILFQSGGPVLFIPPIFRGSFRAKRVGICWDGSRVAARALRDARPFLARADALVAISLNEAQVAPAETSVQKLAQHVGRAGLPIDLLELTVTRADVQPTILSLAADESLDMLVMGAYGHSRVQEGLLGGVTREMLRTMTVPTLMSH